MSNSLQPHGLQHARLPEFAQIHVHCVSDAIQLSHPLPPSSPFAVNLFQHQSWFFAPGELGLCTRWPKYCSFSFHISPSSEYSELISFKFPDLTSLQSKELSRGFSSTTIQKHHSVFILFQTPGKHQSTLPSQRFAYPEHFI